MHRALVYIIPALFLFSAHCAMAKTLYTWTDKDGVVHITESKPPAGAQQTDKTTYKARPKKETSNIDQHKATEHKAWLLENEARTKAKRARREADKAKSEMETAIEESNRVKSETDEYIRQWGYQSRHRKSIKAKIMRKKDATNQAVAESERLIKMATEAEAKAQGAEKELNDLQLLSRESKAYTRNLEAESRDAATQSD